MFSFSPGFRNRYLEGIEETQNELLRNISNKKNNAENEATQNINSLFFLGVGFRKNGLETNTCGKRVEWGW